MLPALAACAAVMVSACGGAQPQPLAASSSQPNDDYVEPPLPPLPAGHVWRVQVMKVLRAGMPAFLRTVPVQEVLTSGRFYGWRVLELRGDPTFWQGADIKPGDVVTRANGHELGHYDEAYGVWQSLAIAPMLVIEYERGGQKKELRLTIHDDAEMPGAAPTGSAPAAPPPAKSAAPPKPAPASSK